MQVAYKNSFLRMFKELDPVLQAEARIKIELFKNPKHHKELHTHPLRGPLRGRFAFSVNFSTRIVFEYVDRKRTAVLLSIGDHDVYN